MVGSFSQFNIAVMIQFVQRGWFAAKNLSNYLKHMYCNKEHRHARSIFTACAVFQNPSGGAVIFFNSTMPFYLFSPKNCHQSPGSKSLIRFFDYVGRFSHKKVTIF